MSHYFRRVPRRDRTRKRAGTIILVLLLTLLTGIVLAAGTPTIDWWVIGSGGAQVSSGAHSLHGTLGQPVTGLSSSGSYDLCAGYWCGAQGQYTIYLPVVMRTFP